MNAILATLAAAQLATLSVLSPTSGELTVSIRSTDGKPVPGATVLILPDAPAFSDVRSCGCVTASDGIARFQNVPDGSFAAMVTAPEPEASGAGLYFFIRDPDQSATPPAYPIPLRLVRSECALGVPPTLGIPLQQPEPTGNVHCDFSVHLKSQGNSAK